MKGAATTRAGSVLSLSLFSLLLLLLLVLLPAPWNVNVSLDESGRSSTNWSAASVGRPTLRSAADADAADADAAAENPFQDHSTQRCGEKKFKRGPIKKMAVFQRFISTRTRKSTAKNAVKIAFDFLFFFGVVFRVSRNT